MQTYGWGRDIIRVAAIVLDELVDTVLMGNDVSVDGCQFNKAKCMAKLWHTVERDDLN